MLALAASSDLLFARSTITKRRHPTSTASGTPFHQPQSSTRGAPSSLRPSQCVWQQMASARTKQRQRSASNSLILSTQILQNTYVEIRQVRADVRAHFLVVDLVAAVLGVPAHGAGAVALVEVLAGLLGVERQATDRAEEGRGGTHFCGSGGPVGVLGDVCGPRRRRAVPSGMLDGMEVREAARVMRLWKGSRFC